ncbi:hypothetical protein TRVL_08813 [Trypanosoma vivax]|nr:hypothetical protein TRVL_08813 [Trypanosoma vivax]
MVFQLHIKPLPGFSPAQSGYSLHVSSVPKSTPRSISLTRSSTIWCFPKRTFFSRFSIASAIGVGFRLYAFHFHSSRPPGSVPWFFPPRFDTMRTILTLLRQFFHSTANPRGQIQIPLSHRRRLFTPRPSPLFDVSSERLHRVLRELCFHFVHCQFLLPCPALFPHLAPLL